MTLIMWKEWKWPRIGRVWTCCEGSTSRISHGWVVDVGCERNRSQGFTPWLLTWAPRIMELPFIELEDQPWSLENAQFEESIRYPSGDTEKAVRKMNIWQGSLVVQWLRLWATNAGGAGLIPGWGTKIPHALQRDQIIKTWGFPSGSEGKESTCNVGDPGSTPESGGFLWRREWRPTLVFLPGEFHGQRSLAGYSPWDQKESNMTEWLTHTYF